MIKIQIDNAHQKLQEYTNAIINPIANRVSILQQSLSHLNGTRVDFRTGDFRSFKAVTRSIINIVGDNFTIQNGRNGYTSSIAKYTRSANNLANINIARLLQFCSDMVANSNQMLSELLVCGADNLMILNNNILNTYSLTSPEEIAVIKLAFDYTKYNEDIAIPIKTYFRTQRFVSVCPYCNVESVNHQVNNSREVVRSFELDHFYDKSRYPLLSYSFFNLIPSDHTCNVTNKRDTEFTDEYHINPHLSGYTDLIRFIPIGLNPDYEVAKIKLIISAATGSARYKTINGNNLPDLEDGSLGNLNVFKIRSKHLDETHRAGAILKVLRTNDTYLKHLWKYLKKLTGLNMKDSYREWYEKELNVRFHESNFNEKAYSKFSRDIHDHYYSMNITMFNKYIIELSKE